MRLIVAKVEVNNIYLLIFAFCCSVSEENTY